MMFFLMNVLWYRVLEQEAYHDTTFVAPWNLPTVVMSTIADANIFCDWWFYNGIKDEDSIDQAARDAALAFAIVGTVTWLNHAVLHGFPTSVLCVKCSGGRTVDDLGTDVNPCAQVCCVGMWGALLWEVILNDIPMLVLTIVIESAAAGALTKSGVFGPAAVMNIATACCDILAKMYEAYSFMKREANNHGECCSVAKVIAV